MKPEYIGFGNFDTINYVYAYCKCPLPVDYAIKWPLIKDGKPHVYTCKCNNCGATVSVMAKSYGPEVYKEMEMKAAKKAIKALKESYDEFGFFDPFSIKEKESNDYTVSIKEVHEAITRWAGNTNVIAARLTSEVRSLLDSIHSLQPKMKIGWIPVSERLPEDHKDVLICLSSDQICIGCYNSHKLPFSNNAIGWGASYTYNWCSNNVIAWMPLPEPYKQEIEDKNEN